MNQNEETENPNDKQVGGSHYRGTVQHWDFIELNGLGYLEGIASKYMCRLGKKPNADILEDLSKAKHCVDKLIYLHNHHGRNNRRIVNRREDGSTQFLPTRLTVSDLQKAYEMSWQAAEFLKIMFAWKTETDLRYGIFIINSVLDDLVNSGREALEKVAEAGERIENRKFNEDNPDVPASTNNNS